MSFVQDIVESIFGDYKDAVLLLLAVAIVVFAAIGIQSVIRDFLGPTHSTSNPHRNNRRRTTTARDSSSGKLKALLLGGLAVMGPRLYQQVVRTPEFVHGLDRVLDGCQAKLREMVVSTASVRDDALLDAIDSVLDGVQASLREQVLARTQQAPNASQNQQRRRP